MLHVGNTDEQLTEGATLQGIGRRRRRLEFTEDRCTCFTRGKSAHSTSRCYTREGKKSYIPQIRALASLLQSRQEHASVLKTGVPLKFMTVQAGCVFTCRRATTSAYCASLPNIQPCKTLPLHEHIANASLAKMYMCTC